MKTFCIPYSEESLVLLLSIFLIIANKNCSSFILHSAFGSGIIQQCKRDILLIRVVPFNVKWLLGSSSTNSLITSIGEILRRDSMMLVKTLINLDFDVWVCRTHCIRELMHLNRIRIR